MKNISTITIYLFSDDQDLKSWSNSFSENLSLISNQIFNIDISINIEKFSGKLNDSNKHLFILSEATTENSSVDVSHGNTYQIHLSPLNFRDIPSFLTSIPLYSFYDFDLIKNVPKWSDLDSSTGNSWEKLLDFVKNIHGIYKRNRGTIYLSYTTPDQTANRLQLRQDLLSNGYNVIPESPIDDSNEPKLNQQIKELTSTAILSIHIYGNSTSFYSSNEIDVVDYQNKVCSSLPESDLQRLIWIPKNSRLSKENLEKIDILKKDLDLLKGAELVEAPLELFKSLTYQKAEAIQNAEQLNSSGLYFIYDTSKNDDIETIKSKINKSNVELLEVTNTDTNPLLNHKENLQKSGSVIIYYNGMNKNWIESILNDIIKTPKYRNHKDVNPIGIIYSGDLALKPELESYNIEKIDLSNNSQLSNFIKKTNK